MTTKPSFCSVCPINNYTAGYVPLKLGDGTELWVGEAAGETESAIGLPFIGGSGKVLENLATCAGVSKNRANIINTIGCQPKDNVYPLDDSWTWTPREISKYAIEYCRQHHLQPAIDSRPWSRIVAIGEQALCSLTNRRGISVWRGSALPLKTRPLSPPLVMPTYHPSFIMRNSHLSSVVVGDLRKSLDLPPEYYNLYPSFDDVEAFDASCFAFDFEWDYAGNITICGLCDRYYHAIVATWEEPYISLLKHLFTSAKELIGHNIIGADTTYFDKYGWKISARLWDTMLMQHLVQPDYRHSLAFVASVFTHKVFWKAASEEQDEDEGAIFAGGGAQWKTWDTDAAIPREYGGYGGCKSADEAYRLYNARDTDASYQCWQPLKTLLEKHDMLRVYWNVSVPAAFICRDVTAKGLKVDSSRVKIIRDALTKEIEETEIRLPEGLRPIEKPVTKQLPAPPGTWRAKVKSCKGSRKSPHNPVDLVFSLPNTEQICPTCGKILVAGKMQEAKTIKISATERVVPWNSTTAVQEYAKSIGCKQVINKKSKRATADKNARKVWGRTHPEFVIVDTLKRASTRRNSFAKPGLLSVDRMFFNLLVHGTSEGRLASSGRRKGIDANIQNQPKDIRKIFIPDYPDWGFVAADLVQAENMITAWLAKDWPRWERLNTPGFDEHSYMASRFFNEPYEKVCKGGELECLRKPGKVVNHGMNYLLGYIKAQEYLAAEGYSFSAADVKEFFEIWKLENARTAQWQKEVVEIGTRTSQLENPFGRKRWFQCVTPETQTLTTDLNWVPIGSLNIGDEIVGFDENLQGNPKYRRSIVEATDIIKSPIYEVITDKGTTYASPEHGWAVRFGTKGHRYSHRWITTKYLQEGDTIVWFANPWQKEQSREAIWLGGLLDGDGCVSNVQRIDKYGTRYGRGDVRLSQNPGLILNTAIKIAKELNINVSEPRPTGTRKVNEVRLTCDSPRSMLEIIGRLQSLRLINYAKKIWDGTPMWGKTTRHEVATVKSIKYVGEGNVVAIGTSTQTLLTNGLCSHNSRTSATKMAAFLPASTVADAVLRMMMALYAHDDRITPAVRELGIGVTGRLPDNWDLRIQVHDELTTQGPWEARFDTAHVLKAIMTQPWPELDGFAFKVEIAASNVSWGDVKEIKI